MFCFFNVKFKNILVININVQKTLHSPKEMTFIVNYMCKQMGTRVMTIVKVKVRLVLMPRITQENVAHRAVKIVLLI